jgi:Na+:H+ antiporter, NhaA family
MGRRRSPPRYDALSWTTVRREDWSARRRTMPDRAPSRGVRQPFSRSDRPLARRVAKPLQSFLDEEVASGLLLLAATVVALVWANSPWRTSYDELWHTTFTVRIGSWSLSEDLRHWVNEGLMSLFFLVVGLEIKRELLIGELRTLRAAALPALAAIGGMIAPALIYLAFNAGGPGERGWGIPMATDIAFALGVLTLAARRAPPGLKPFLLTLAIVDDIGAILVIAVAYSGGVSWPALGVAALVVLAIVVLQRIHVRAATPYVLLGVGLWLALFESGVHPTIAGVILGLLSPAVPFQRPRAVSDEAHRVADETLDEPDPPDADAEQWLYLQWLSREAVSPLARIETLLHPWTTGLVVPLFALANAGVELSADALRGAATERVALGIVTGLVVGKFVGILGASWLAVRLGVAVLPSRLRWRDIVGGALVGGIGFTVSLFMADLAFSGDLVDVAKIGVLTGSLIAGVAGFAWLRLAGR